jgi:DNA-binding beta-propeller fold protein YncE
MSEMLMPHADVRPIPVVVGLGAWPIGRGPVADLAAGSRRDTIVATNYGDDTVSILDTDAPHDITTVAVPGEPYAVAAAAHYAYVATAAADVDRISVVDARAGAVVGILPLELHAMDLAVARNGKRLYVSRSGPEGGDLAIIEVATGRVTAVDIAAGPGAAVETVRVGKNGRIFVAVSDAAGARLAVVDPRSMRMVAAIPTAGPIRDVALSRDGRTAYVLACDLNHGGVVQAVDTTTKRAVASAWIGGWPTQLALGADETRAYAIDQDRVNVLCMVTNEVIDSIFVGGRPSCVTTSADGTRLYVADYDGVVTAFDITSATFDCAIDADTVEVEELRELAPAGV